MVMIGSDIIAFPQPLSLVLFLYSSCVLIDVLQALQMLMRYMEDTSTDSGLRLIEDQGDALYRAVTDAVISILPAATCGG